MSNDQIYQMPLIEAIKYVPVARLVSLIPNPVFAKALLKACKKQGAKA